MIRIKDNLTYNVLSNYTEDHLSRCTYFERALQYLTRDKKLKARCTTIQNANSFEFIRSFDKSHLSEKKIMT